MSDPIADRRWLVRHLEAVGPTPGDVLAADVGLTPERFWGLINCPWFDITGRGWIVSGRGRAEAFARPAADTSASADGGRELVGAGPSPFRLPTKRPRFEARKSA